MSIQSVLFVDDDEKILNGIQRQLAGEFDVSVACGPHPALDMLRDEGPYAVVVSDMRMPEMNGVELLKKVRDLWPNTVRMMLTGYAELETTIEAVNEGHIFRFLAKPCSSEDLEAALNAALKQYSLVEAEKELVEGTLRGSVKVLSDVLSLVSPLAFGQASRVRQTVDGILKRISIENPWKLEIAAMLSPLGCVTLPEELLKKKLAGEPLSPKEEQTYSSHPPIAQELLHAVPRLADVAEIIGNQDLPQSVATLASGKPVPLECRILKVAIDFDLHEITSPSPIHAFNKLKECQEQYDPCVIEALGEFVKSERNLAASDLHVSHLQDGMVLADHVLTTDGTLLMSKGQQISSSARQRLLNFALNKKISGTIRVIVDAESIESPKTPSGSVAAT